MYPDRVIWGYIVLSCVFVVLSVVNFNLWFKFLPYEIQMKILDFDMHTPLMKPLSLIL